MEVSNQPKWFGIDVSKATFDIGVSPGEARKGPHLKLPRTREGCETCWGWVDRQVVNGQVPALVMEATSGYGKEMANWLLALRQEARIAIVQPWRVRQYAKGFGVVNKTDAQDAILLARFGETYNPRPYHPMTPAYEQLRALTRERAAMVKETIRLGNRNDIESNSPIAQKIREQTLAQVEQAVKELDQAIKVQIAKDAELKRDSHRLQTVPGVGPVVSTTLMGECGDLRDYAHRKALLAFTGVAVKVSESGTSVHNAPHMTKRGSGRVRQVLYMGAMAATRGRSPMAEFYQRLVKEGKPDMVALGALMRKILVTCRAVLVEEQDYDPKYLRTPPSELL
jgi:transposase